ncbi:MAG: phosphatidate cytidylyltransferase [Pseudomonadota bacterium]
MPEAGKAEFGLRVLSAAVLAIVVVADVIVGGWSFTVLVGLVTILVAAEWGNLLARRYANPALRVAAAVPPAATAIVAMLLTKLIDPGYGLLVIAVVALAVAGIARRAGWPVRWTSLGVVYIALAPTLLVWMRNASPEGLVFVLFLFAAVWAADSFAYLVGRSLRGPKLAPVWSPNKTWSGFVGGSVAAGVAGGLVAFGFALPFVGGAVVLGVVIGVVAQVGDLFVSRFKRLAGMKDTGTLIPGHGGALDRLDGLMYATPAFAGFVALHP